MVDCIDVSPNIKSPNSKHIMCSWHIVVLSVLIAEFYLITFCYRFLHLYSWVLYFPFLVSWFLLFLLSVFEYQGNSSFIKMDLAFSWLLFLGRDCVELVLKFYCEMSWPGDFCFGGLSIINVCPLLGIGLHHWSISLWVGCCLYSWRNWPMSCQVWYLWRQLGMEVRLSCCSGSAQPGLVPTWREVSQCSVVGLRPPTVPCKGAGHLGTAREVLSGLLQHTL